MNDHPLDRAAWHALTTRLAHVAQGDARAVRMNPEYGQFSAPRDFTPENLEALAALIPPHDIVSIAPTKPFTPPPGTRIVDELILHQMLADRLAVTAPDFPVMPLGDADAEEMRALATLTEPGPFLIRTQQLGDFAGVRVDGKLVAMAGERLKLPGYTEISAVCTHPDHAGRGHAQRLVALVTCGVFEQREQPFLHVSPGNDRAKNVYLRLGYVDRCDVALYSLHREVAAG